MKWIAAAALLLSGCASMVSNITTHPGHKGPYLALTPGILAKLHIQDAGPCQAPCIAFDRGQPWPQAGSGPTPTLQLEIDSDPPRHDQVTAAQSQLTGTAILLPGYGESRQDMLAWAVYFQSRGFHTLVPDLPGQGATGIDDFSFGVRDASYLAPWFQAQGTPGPVIVVGHSMGAISATYLAKTIHADGLVLLAPSSPFLEATQGAAHFFFPTLSRWLPASSLGSGLADALHTMGISNAQTDLRPLLAAMTQPVLVMSASHDGVIADDWPATLQGPALTQRTFARDNHFTLALPTQEKRQQLDLWLARLEGKPVPIETHKDADPGGAKDTRR